MIEKNEINDESSPILGTDENRFQQILEKEMKNFESEEIQKTKYLNEEIDALLAAKGLKFSQEVLSLLKIDTIKGISTQGHLASVEDILEKSIAKFVRTVDPICLERGKTVFVAILGQSGGGKTTVTMQMAMLYLEAIDKRVSLISFGTHYQGASEKLSTLGKQYGIPVSLVSHVEDLKIALESFRNYDLILIDVEEYSSNESIKQMVGALKQVGEVHVQFVLSALTDEEDAKRMIKSAEGVPIAGLIFTHVKNVSNAAKMLNVSYESKLPLSYFARGKGIPHDLRVADPTEIAHNTRSTG